MAIENAVGQLREDLATGKVTEDDLVRTVNEMGLLEGTKASVLEEIRRSSQINQETLAPEVEVTPQVTAEVPAQTQPAPLVGTSFFSEGQEQDYTFFDQFAQPSTKPKSEHKASELGTLVSMSMAGDGEDVQGVMQEVAADLVSTGASPLLSSFLDERTRKEVGSINAALWQNLEALTGVQADPQAGLDAQALVQEQSIDVKTLEKVSQLVAEVSSNLTPEQRQYFGDFQHVAGEVMYRRAIDDMLSRKSDSDLERSSVSDWFTALLNPAQSVAGRYDQGKLLGILQESFGESVGLDQYVFKSAHADKIVQYLTDPNLTVDELYLRLEELQSVVSSLDEVAPEVNPVWSNELFDVIKDELRKANSGQITLGNIADAFDTLDATIIAGVVKKLPALAKMASLKILGRASMNASWSPSTIAEINRVINSAIEDSAVASRAMVREVTPDVNVQTGTGSLLDTMKETNPEQASVLLAKAIQANPKAVQALGVTPEQLVERLVPDPSSPIGVHPNMLTDVPTNSERVNRSVKYEQFQRELLDHSALTLLREGELAEVPDKYSKMVAKNSRGTLHPSASEILGEESGGLLIRSVFGASKDGGYSTIGEADNAAKFLFGESYEILAKPRGIQSELMQVQDVSPDFTGELEFFVRSEAKVRPNTAFVNDFNSEILFPSNMLSDSLLSFSRRLETDIFDTVNSYFMKSTRLAGLQRNMLSPILRMNSGKDKADWFRMLAHGDAEEIVFASKGQAETVLGTNISNRTWKAYTGARDFYDSMAQVRQVATYNKLNVRGFKSVYTRDGILQDLSGQVQAKPIVERPTLSSTKPTQAPLGDTTTVWGKELYDVTTGSYVPLTDDLLDSIYNDTNKMVVGLSRYAEFTDGKAVTYAIVNTTDIKPLTNTPMNIRKGHIDVNYKGEDALAFLGYGHKGGTSFKVEATVSRQVNGVDDTYSKAVGIYANKAQADEARAAMVAQEIDELGGAATEADILAIEAKYTSKLTVEGELEVGLDITGSTTGLPAHARKRGERLLGPEGLAHVLDPEEALNKGVHEARRHLGVEAIDMLKERFSQTYGKFMDGYEGFSPDFGGYSAKWSDTAKANGVVDDAQRFHRFISNMERSLSGKDVTMLLNHLDSWGNSLRVKGSDRLGSALKSTSKAADAAFETIKALNTVKFIASRFFYQILGNSSSIMWLFTRSPVSFVKDTLRSTIASSISLGFGDKFPPSMLAKLYGKGMTPDKFNLYMKNMKESGMFSTNFGNDILATLSESAKIEAGRHNPLSASFYKKLNPVNFALSAGRVAMVPQRMAQDLANLFAWNQAAADVIKAKGVDYAVGRRGKEEISSLATRLTFNQNRADQFDYQQNFLSAQLQFFQHVHRMSLDLLIDPTLRVASPALKAVTGGKSPDLKVSVDGANPYADSWRQSFITLAGISGMFGLGTYALTDDQKVSASSWAEDQGMNPELVTLFMDGLAAKGVEGVFGESFDLTSRITPIGAVKSMFEMMFTNDGGFIIGGPSQALWTTFKDISAVVKSFVTTSDETSESALRLMKEVGTKSLSGLSDVEKAWVAYQWGQYQDSNGKQIANVSDLSWIPILFSIPPTAVQDYYRQLDKVYAQEDKVNTAVKLANNVAIGMLDDYPKDQINGGILAKAIAEGNRVIDLTLGRSPKSAEAAKQAFSQRLAFTPDGLLVSHADKLFTTLESKQSLAELRRYAALHPEDAALANMLIEFLERKQEE